MHSQRHHSHQSCWYTTTKVE